MGKPTPSYRPKETRVRSLGEVSLGLSKKIAQDEARRCPQCAMAACLPGCPLGIDIPGFIRFLREGDTVLALERIKQENPFPAICGRICPAPCEQACVFQSDGNPISIRGLERFAADFGQSKAEKLSLALGGKKVAIIGAGPAGMSASYYLAKMNFSVTIFEAAHEPGGFLRYTVPEFRLPQKVLDEQFSQLKRWGVEIQTDVVFGRTMMTDELFMRGFSAILLATGAGLPIFSDLPGSSLGGVFYDKEFLYRLQAIKKEDALQAARRQMIGGPNTVVIGCGQSAFDAARLIVRLGGKVQVIFEGFEEQAGVDHDILKESREEGIEIHSIKALEMVGDAAGFVQGVKCRKLDIVDGKNGLKLEPSQDKSVILEAQTVIIANGQRPNDLLKNYLPQLKWDNDGSLWADAQSGMTSIDKVFGCGSVVTGGGSVVDAIAGGKAAAQKIIEYLK
ncbi:MAG: FAD-dependent oxidoreductase [Candidatus Omnitrophica bacterium]|nr:FAD-dependent oxidoreductase [Candidatus Omnitrophota bacterium]